MSIFNRNKKNTVILPELEKYYEAERRERSGLAWILALISVAGIALVLIGLFFGGRWTYRHFKDDKPATVATVQEDTTSKTTPDSSSQESASSTSSTNGSSSTNTDSTSSQNQSTATTPSASTTQLANTGPGNLVPVFLVTSFLATTLYRLKLNKNN